MRNLAFDLLMAYSILSLVNIRKSPIRYICKLSRSIIQDSSVDNICTCHRRFCSNNSSSNFILTVSDKSINSIIFFFINYSRECCLPNQMEMANTIKMKKKYMKQVRIYVVHLRLSPRVYKIITKKHTNTQSLLRQVGGFLRQ